MTGVIDIYSSLFSERIVGQEQCGYFLNQAAKGGTSGSTRDI